MSLRLIPCRIADLASDLRLGLVAEGGSSSSFIARMGASRAKSGALTRIWKAKCPAHMSRVALILGKKITVPELASCAFVNKVYPDQPAASFRGAVVAYFEEKLDGLDRQSIVCEPNGILQADLLLMSRAVLQRSKASSTPLSRTLRWRRSGKSWAQSLPFTRVDRSGSSPGSRRRNDGTSSDDRVRASQAVCNALAKRYKDFKLRREVTRERWASVCEPLKASRNVFASVVVEVRKRRERK